MSYAFILLLVCGQPAASFDALSGRYTEFPPMDTQKAVEFINGMTKIMEEAKVPYLVREIGRGCE